MSQEKVISIIPDAKAPIVLGVTKQYLGKLKKKYAKVPDATTKEGYEAIKTAKRELVPLRTGVEKEAKIQKEAAQKHINNINSVKNTIIETIQAIEKPLYDAKQAVDDAETKAKQAEIDKENERIAGIESKINAMQNMANGLLGATVAVLENRKTELEAIDLTAAVFMEFVDPATVVKGQVMAQLTSAIDQAKQLEAGQEALKKQQEELAESQKAIEEQQIAAQKKIDDQQAEIDRQNAEKAEQDRQEALKKQQEEKAAELKARLPEDTKMREYAVNLLNVVPPDVESPEMCALLREVCLSLADIKGAIMSGTQDTE